MTREMTWAEHNLPLHTVQDLREQKVGIHLAPNVPVGIKVVRLSDGKVDVVQPQERPRSDGYYAEQAGLVEYCRREGISIDETNGYMVAERRRS